MIIPDFPAMSSAAPPQNAARERLWRNARLATMASGAEGIGAVDDGAVLVRGERIVFAGSASGLPPHDVASCEVIDCEGRWMTPGLVDCHTHLVHAGNRAMEFELRLRGATYQDIAAAGGGILSTLRNTRAASLQQLIDESLPRLDALIAEGVTAIEIKSGYGLDLESERRMLQAARELGRLRRIHVHTTFLGAHAVPPEMAGEADAYIERVTAQMLPALAAEGLVVLKPRRGCYVTELSEQDIDGTFDGLAPDGALRLRRADGEVMLIHAGDIELRRPVEKGE